MKTKQTLLFSNQKLAEFKNGIETYTDGSKDKNNVAAVAVINKDVFFAIFPDETTIFSAEAN